jgi:hypothetical protein
VLCAPRVKRIALPIVRFDAVATPTTVDVVLWMKNPSVMLAAMVAIVLQADNGQVIVLGATAVWQIYGALPPNGGDLLANQPLSAVFTNSTGVPTARALPDGYTINDPTKLAKITATIAATGAGQTGTVYAVATWEPFDPMLSAERTIALFGECDISIDGGRRNLSAT